MTIKKHFRIEHIVVLARKQNREFYHYECYTREQIENHLPVKIFFNGFDFTHKLTLSSRLTKYSLTYIMEHYKTKSFRRIAQHFRERQSAKLIKKRFGKRKQKKKTTQLSSFDATLANMRKDKPGPEAVRQNSKPFVASKDTPNTSREAPAFKAVPYDYGVTELVMKEAKLKRTIGQRGFISYLQCLSHKLEHEFRAKIKFHFDHSVFSYLIENELKNESELIDVMDSIMCKSIYPTREDLQHLFSTMRKLGKVDIELDTKDTTDGYDVIEDIIDVFVEYFENKIKAHSKATQKEKEPDKVSTGKRKRGTTRKSPCKRKR